MPNFFNPNLYYPNFYKNLLLFSFLAIQNISEFLKSEYYPLDLVIYNRKLIKEYLFILNIYINKYKYIKIIYINNINKNK